MTISPEDRFYAQVAYHMKEIHISTIKAAIAGADTITDLQGFITKEVERGTEEYLASIDPANSLARPII